MKLKEQKIAQVVIGSGGGRFSVCLKAVPERGSGT